MFHVLCFMTMDLDQLKELRQKTGVSITQCKEAIEEAGGDMEKAVKILRKKGEKVANKKAGREIKSGLIETYIHGEGKIGVMLELGCETDFVARTDDFKNLAHDIAMHIAATSPRYLNPEDIPQDVVKAEKDIYIEQLKGSGKPKDIVGRIIEGKMKKYSEEVSLLTQPFIKNSDVTIANIVHEKVGKLGENIQVRRFVRYEI